MNEMRKDRRAPASLKVKYKSATVDDFIEQFGADVSRGGIFIKTKKPLETGALLKFEFQLQGGSAVIHGVGRVAWRRLEEKARADLPAGMGIKFIKLDDDSRSVIERIEARHGSGSRFDQTEDAELAPPLSSLPPTLTMNGLPTSSPAATGGSQSGRRPVPNAPAKAAPVKTEQPTFRPPPPAISSIPPALADAWPASTKPQPPPPVAAGAMPSAPKGALGSSFFPPAGGARKGPPSARSSARDSSEFLASAFSVGGAGHEVRSAARVQVERARRDPESVDLANELFGDLSEPSNNGANAKAPSDPAALADLRPASDPKLPSPRERTLSEKIPSIEELVNEVTHAGAGVESMRSPQPLGPISVPVGGGPLLASEPAPLALALSNAPKPVTLRPDGSQGRGLGRWVLGSSALVAVAAGAFFFVQMKQPSAQVGPKQPAASAPEVPAAPQPATDPAPPSTPTQTPVDVSVSVTSEPRGAQVFVDDTAAGTTPATLPLKTTQTVQLRVQTPGYAPTTRALTPTVDMPAQHIVLAPLGYSLVIRTDPPGATVRVNDVSAVSPGPLGLGHLEGMVTAQIEKEGFQRMSRTLRLEDFVERDGAMRADVSLSLSPLPGSALRRKPAHPVAPVLPPPGAPPEPVAPVVQVKPEPATGEPAAEKPLVERPIEKVEQPAAPPAAAAKPKEEAPGKLEPQAAPAPSPPPPAAATP